MLSRRLFTLSLLAASMPLWAKPQRMRIVVPYPAGGPLDAAARITAESIKSRYGRVIVENRAGAAGARAMLEVKNAASDGMTLAVGALATLVSLLFNDLPYSPKDFSAVCLLSDVPNVLVMSPKTMQRLSVHDAKDVIQYIRRNPGKLNCASGGTGSAGHILNALFAAQGLNTIHVPYAGAMAAQLSVLSGETDLMFDNYASARTAIADGRLRVLAQTRNEADSDIKAPTLTSIGIDCDISTWFGLIAPKNTPLEVRQTLFADIQSALSVTATAEKFAQISGGGAKLLGPEAFEKWIAAEQVKYASILKTLSK